MKNVYKIIISSLFIAIASNSYSTPVPSATVQICNINITDPSSFTVALGISSGGSLASLTSESVKLAHMGECTSHIVSSGLYFYAYLQRDNSVVSTITDMTTINSDQVLDVRL